MINIALPKGRLGERVYDMLERAGYGCPSIKEPGRKLIFENAEAGVRYFWVKPSDVSIYVERGAADIGIAGGDGEGLLFKKGEIIRKIKEKELVDELIREIKLMP